MKTSSGQSCKLCQRIRWFIAAGIALNAAVFLQPDWAQGLAELMPSPMTIGLAIVTAAVILFAIRYWRYRN